VFSCDSPRIGGSDGWDNLTADKGSHRLSVSHRWQVDVVDPDTGEKAGSIAETPGVHGNAVASGPVRTLSETGKTAPRLQVRGRSRGQAIRDSLGVLVVGK
jgi:hypothetical protein